MVVYGNIAKRGTSVQDSVYRGMSAIFVRGLRVVHDLGDVLYFESNIDTTHRQLKGLAMMSTLQAIAPFSLIKRPTSADTRLSTDEVQAIIAVCANQTSTTVKS